MDNAGMRKKAATKFGIILSAQASTYLLLLGAVFAIRPEITRSVNEITGVTTTRISYPDFPPGTEVVIYLLIALVIVAAITGIVMSVLTYRKHKADIGQAGIPAVIISCLMLIFGLQLSVLAALDAARIL